MYISISGTAAANSQQENNQMAEHNQSNLQLIPVPFYSTGLCTWWSNIQIRNSVSYALCSHVSAFEYKLFVNFVAESEKRERNPWRGQKS